MYIKIESVDFKVNGLNVEFCKDDKSFIEFHDVKNISVYNETLLVFDCQAFSVIGKETDMGIFNNTDLHIEIESDEKIIKEFLK